MVYNNVLDLIGNTPIIKLNNINKNILLKLEMTNPGGSIKDRVAKEIILDAFNKNIINNESIIIEPTSGNTGIGIALVCNYLNIKCIICMPENMSIERINLLKSLKATVVLTDKKLGMKGSIAKANELHQLYPNSYIPSQFSNINNPLAHYKTTAEEIIKQTDGKIDYFVASIGSGGTITGVGKRLKEYNPNIKIIGIEPKESPLITSGIANSHKIQGVGANFIPEVLDLQIIDEIILVSYEESKVVCNELLSKEGIFAGVSTGCSVKGALNILNRISNEGKTVVCIAPDGGEKYVSTDLYK